MLINGFELLRAWVADVIAAPTFWLLVPILVFETVAERSAHRAHSSQER